MTNPNLWLKVRDIINPFFLSIHFELMEVTPQPLNHIAVLITFTVETLTKLLRCFIRCPLFNSLSKPTIKHVGESTACRRIKINCRTLRYLCHDSYFIIENTGMPKNSLNLAELQSEKQSLGDFLAQADGYLLY